jgi:NADH-quinone oxidoreductase subunit C
MADPIKALATQAEKLFADAITNVSEDRGELTLEVRREDIRRVCQALRDDRAFGFEQLIDLCGVDYLAYGREAENPVAPRPRYGVVYHLLSVAHNQRLRVRTYLDADFPVVDSVVDVWASANWFEREAFDLFGIVFEGHPDLRRILTDYGFIGHPFRKDFPLSGEVEMRYDPDKQRVVYEPVSIEPRVLVPRVIREEGYGGRDT